MANILGNLLVELGVNTAAWQEGLSKATYQAKAFGQEVQRSFSNIGNSISNVLGQFGPLGGVIGNSLGSVGNALGSATKMFSNMGGAAGVMAGAVVGAGAAVAAVGGAFTVLASHALTNAANLNRLAQSAGVSTETLSRLQVVAKFANIDIEQLAKGLARMSKTALEAATAPAGTINAYTRLGISVRDASGEIKPVDRLMIELADKFSHMEDGIVKTGLAMKLFGRAGALLIPVLNDGAEEIRKFMAEADALGITITSSMGQAAEMFDRNIDRMKFAGAGFGNILGAELLPALKTVTDEIVKSLKDPESGLRSLIVVIALTVKAFLTLGEVVVATFSQVKIIIEGIIGTLQEVALLASSIVKNVWKRDWDALVTDARKGGANLIATWKGTARDSVDVWKGFGASVSKIFGDVALPAVKPRGLDTKVDLAPKSGILEGIKARIAALQREAADWLKLSLAATQAEALILEATKKGNEEFNKLIIKAEKNAVALAYVKQHEEVIKTAAATSVYGAAIKALTGDLDKQVEKTRAEARDASLLADAYRKGGAAIADAFLAKNFAEQEAKIKTLTDAHRLLADQLGLDNVLVRQLADGIEIQRRKLVDLTVETQKKLAANLAVQLAGEKRQYDVLAPLIDQVNRARMEGIEVLTGANIELELERFRLAEEAKGIRLTIDQLAAKRALLRAGADQQRAAAVSEEASRLTINSLYDQEVKRLREVRDLQLAAGKSTLLTDAAIRDSQERIMSLIARTQIRFGGMRDAARGFFTELVLQGEHLQEKVFNALLKAFDDLSSQLAKFVVEGKANFKELLRSLEENILKATFQKGIGDLARIIGKKIGIDIPGLGGKPSGTSADPIYVFVKNLAGGGIGGLGGLLGAKKIEGEAGAGGIEGKVDSVFGKVQSALGKILSSIGSVFGRMFSALGGLFGSIFGGIGGLFGGFRAVGGDVTPGRAFIVGERRPEFFVPKVSGTIMPQLTTGDTRTTNLSVNFHGVTDADSFKKNRAQISAEIFRQSQRAFART